MIIVALLIGVILIVAAIRNSQGALFDAIGTDVPGFVVWAAAILALGAVGYLPGLKPVSRGLMALVLVVIVLRNYQSIIGGFQGAFSTGSSGGSSSGGTGSTSPTGAPSIPDYTLDGFIQHFGYAPGSANDPFKYLNNPSIGTFNPNNTVQ